MKNLKVMKMITILLVVLMVVTISTNVLATDELVNPINILTNVEETPTTNVEPVVPTTNTETGEGTLPQTGDASDYAVFLLIAVCVFVSVYAYKKVRDYNKI